MAENPFQVDLDEEELSVLQHPSEPYFESASRPSNNETTTSSTPASDPASRLAQLRAREAELLRRQQEIADAQKDFIPSINFPSFFPLIHYDLETDIPTAAQKAVKFGLYGLITFIARAAFNILTVLSVRGLPGYNHPVAFVFAIIQGAAGVYCAFNFCFLKLYTACRKHEVPMTWTIYQFLLIAWIAYLIIGFPSSGSVGFATFLDLVSKSDSGFSKFMAFINTVGAGACAYFEVRCMMGTNDYSKVSGVDEALLRTQTNSNTTIP